MSKRHGLSWSLCGASVSIVISLCALYFPTTSRPLISTTSFDTTPLESSTIASVESTSTSSLSSSTVQESNTTAANPSRSFVSPQSTEAVEGLPGVRFSNQGYSTVWSDDFSGTSLDSSLWSIYGYTLSYDRSCYTSNNVTVSSGLLDIRTSQDGTCGKPYSSGYIRNTGMTDQLVSPTQSPSGVLRIEMRAQMPTWQKGIWPGLWTRNTMQSPNYGEVDLIEQWGVETSSSVFAVTSHFGSAGTQKAKVFNAGTALDQGMHTYTTEININNGGSIAYFIDGTLVATHVASDFPGGDFLGMLRDKWDARIMVQTTSDQQTYAGGARNDSVMLVDTHLKVDWVRYSLKN